MKRNPQTLAVIVLVLAMLACNLPGNTPSISVDDQAATIIAQTLTAQPTTKSVTATASFTPTIAATSTSGSTPTITPTYSTPFLTVLQQTNCREGPGQDYQVVYTFLAGKKLEIAGRYEPTNFWLVKTLETRTGTCWMWGEYVELSGSYWVVPTLTPPPTATLAPPQAPTIQNWNFECSGGNMHFTVEWTDRSTTETGYRIFRDGVAVYDLAANSTSFQETIPLQSGESVTYYLQAFGPSGSANSSTMRATC